MGPYESVTHIEVYIWTCVLHASVCIYVYDCTYLCLYVYMCMYSLLHMSMFLHYEHVCACDYISVSLCAHMSLGECVNVCVRGSVGVGEFVFVAACVLYIHVQICMCMFMSLGAHVYVILCICGHSRLGLWSVPSVVGLHPQPPGSPESIRDNLATGQSRSCSVGSVFVRVSSGLIVEGKREYTQTKLNLIQHTLGPTQFITDSKVTQAHAL